MNLSFLRKFHSLWKDDALLGDTINLNFTAILYWRREGILKATGLGNGDNRYQISTGRKLPRKSMTNKNLSLESDKKIEVRIFQTLGCLLIMITDGYETDT